jgi:hypothetical protein
MRKGEVLTNDPDMVHDMGKTLLLLSRAFEQKSQSLSKILKAMFAPQTEKSSEILKHDQALGNETSEEADHQCPDDAPEGKSKAQPSPKKGTGKIQHQHTRVLKKCVFVMPNSRAETFAPNTQEESFTTMTPKRLFVSVLVHRYRPRSMSCKS